MKPIKVLIVSSRNLISHVVIDLLHGYHRIPFDIKLCKHDTTQISPGKAIILIIDCKNIGIKKLDDWKQKSSAKIVIPIINNSLLLDQEELSDALLEDQLFEKLIPLLVQKVHLYQAKYLSLIVNSKAHVNHVKNLSIVQHLTPREQEVMYLVSLGLLNKEVAFTLKLKESTIKAYLKSIFQKYQVCNRMEAVNIWNQMRQKNMKQTV